MLDYFIRIKKKNRLVFGRRWIWILAWKDAMHNRNRLFIFISSIVIGIAALVAINSFNDNLQRDIDRQAKELLGADLAFSSNNKPFDTAFLEFLDSLKFKTASDSRFASMVYFPKNRGTRLVEVIAIAGRYPFYGKIELTPGSDIHDFYTGKAAMLDESLAIQYNIHPGDSLKLGNSTFTICGLVRQFPGTTNISATFAPAVYLPFNKLNATGLIQYGSRITYNQYLFLSGADVIQVGKLIKPEAEKFHYRIDTVESRKRDLGNSFKNLYRFLNLLGIIALILGSIGVSSSVHIYLREKKESAAVLRCIGASGWQVFYVYFIQINILGLAGTLAGVLLGILIQFFLPRVVSDFLPVAVNFAFSPVSIAEGLWVGFLMSVLFAALPLSDIRLISPLEIFRSSVEPVRKYSKFRYAVLVLVIIFPWLFAVGQTGSWLIGSVFTGAFILIFALLWLVGRLILWSVKKFFPAHAGFGLRQGLANLFRPGNQTVVLIVVIGLGAFILITLNLIQNSLLGQVEFAGSGTRPNTILFDIQPSQKDEVVKFIRTRNIPIGQIVPIVTMRLKSVRDTSVVELNKDSTREISRWALNHEYRVTYRDSLIGSESLQEGKLYPYRGDGDSVLVSVSDGLARNLRLKPKDRVDFDVQGVPLTTYVGSIRKVDWQRIQTNFLVVFPRGVLDQAPQFFVLIFRVDRRSESAALQRELVQKFPNVSVIDLTLILATLDQIFDKVQMVIRFMAIFSVVTGLFVLSGAVANSKYARIRENALLRTIGAVRKQIRGMTLTEYTLLGIFSVITGLLLSILSSWALARYFFEIKFIIRWYPVMLISFGILLLTVGVGWLNTRSILNKSPLEVLRKEV